jgi:iron complex outermembrane receptor protein
MYYMLRPILTGLLVALTSPLYAQLVADLNPVVVSASRLPESQADASVVVDVISQEDIAGSGYSNFSNYLATLPGLNLTRLYGSMGVDASIDLGYMGSAGAQNVLVLLDGERLNPFDSGSLRFGQIPLASLDRIEIRRANGGVLFGDRAQGGVIQLVSRSDEAQLIQLSSGSFGFRKLDSHLGFQTGGTFGSVALLSAESSGYRDFSAARQEAGRVRLGTKGEWGVLEAHTRRYKEKAELPSFLSEQQYISNDRQVGAFPVKADRSGSSYGLRFAQKGSEKGGLVVTYNKQTSEDEVYSLITSHRHALSPEYRWVWGEHRLLVGLDSHDSQVRTQQAQKVNQEGLAFYTQFQRLFGEQTVAVLGARTHEVKNRFQANDQASATKAKSRKQAHSFGLRHHINSAWSAKLGYLMGYRFANADELYYFNSNTYELLSINDSITPMQSQEIYLNLSYQTKVLKASIHMRDVETDDEIGFRFNCGQVLGVAVGCNTNLFNTHRRILGVSADWRVMPGLFANGAIDWVNAKIESGVDKGGRVPLTPRQVIRISFDKKLNKLSLHLLMHHRSNMVQSADESNSLKRIPSRTVFDSGLSASLSGKWDTSLWIRNLADRRYYDFASFNGIYPADGRSVQLVVNGRF